MLIRPFEPHQAQELVALWRASFEHGVGIRDDHPIEEQLAYFVEQVLPHNFVRVVIDGSELVAFMATTPESVSQLYVRIANIGQGIGGRLLALAKAESTGSLWLYTFAQNHNARRFYERKGFREVERESQNMYKLEAIKYVWRRGDA